MLPCVILAGGLGTRMLPFTERLPKTLLEVGGRPFADMQLAWLRDQGVRHVIYSVGYLGERIRAHVGNGARHGLRVDYVDEGAALKGTGGAVRLVVDRGLVDPAFFVLNGDSYLTVTLADVELRFRASRMPALMTVLRNRDRWEMSNAVVAGGLVTLYDKARPAASREGMEWIDYGLSVLQANVVRHVVQPGAVADLADLMHDLSVQGRLAAHEVTDRFYEIGSPQGLRDLEAHLAQGEGARGA